MKKLLLLTLLALSGLSASAQIVSSNSRSMTTVVNKRPVESMSYLRVGLNLGTLSGIKDDISSDYERSVRKVGYDICYGVNQTFAIPGMYWGVELGLGSRGFAAKEEHYDEFIVSGETYYEDIYYKVSLLTHNIKVVPYNVGYKYTIPRTGIAVDVHLGMYLSYDYAGKYVEKWDYESSYWNDDSGRDNYSIKDIFGDSYRRFDIGLNYGFGVWFSDKYSLDIQFQNGFIGILKEYDDICKTRNITIRFGYAL